MVEQRYCGKCHKVFAFENLAELTNDAGKWCPDCYLECGEPLGNDYLKQIELKRLD